MEASATQIVNELRAIGYEARVFQTGGGVHTIYVGPVFNERYDALVGPFGPDLMGYWEEIAVGADDEGEGEMVYPLSSVGEVVAAVQKVAAMREP